MAEIRELPGLTAAQRLSRRPMSLIDHVHASGHHSGIVVALDENNQVFFQCSPDLRLERAVYLLERVKAQLMSGVMPG